MGNYPSERNDQEAQKRNGVPQTVAKVAPTDANLAPGQIVFWVDESANKLMVRVKYSNGTTLKSGTVTLV